MNYNNFHEALAKEKDEKAQARLKAFYKKYHSDYQLEEIDYDSNYGKFLQSAGVDRILSKCRSSGSIINQIWVQEKICFSNYPNLLFEYEKRSGSKGWAVSPKEKADFLLYYHDGEIMVFKFAQLRKWLVENLDKFKRKYRKDTDNKNVCIPKDIVFKNVNVKIYELEDYWTDQDEAEWNFWEDWLADGEGSEEAQL